MSSAQRVINYAGPRSGCPGASIRASRVLTCAASRLIPRNRYRAA